MKTISFYFTYLSASRGGDGGVCVGLWTRPRTRLWDHSSEEGEAVGEAAEARRDVPTLYGTHEEPMGDHGLDGRLESEVKAP